jgi:hypothetical protein
VVSIITMLALRCLRNGFGGNDTWPPCKSLSSFWIWLLLDWAFTRDW